MALGRPLTGATDGSPKGTLLRGSVSLRVRPMLTPTKPISCFGFLKQGAEHREVSDDLGYRTRTPPESLSTSFNNCGKEVVQRLTALILFFLLINTAAITDRLILLLIRQYITNINSIIGIRAIRIIWAVGTVVRAIAVSTTAAPSS